MKFKGKKEVLKEEREEEAITREKDNRNNQENMGRERRMKGRLDQEGRRKGVG